jgi:hypothetical protein
VLPATLTPTEEDSPLREEWVKSRFPAVVVVVSAVLAHRRREASIEVQQLRQWYLPGGGAARCEYQLLYCGWREAVPLRCSELKSGISSADVLELSALVDHQRKVIIEVKGLLRRYLPGRLAGTGCFGILQR